MLGQYQKHEKCFLKAIFTGGRKRKEERADGVTLTKDGKHVLNPKRCS